MDQKLIVFASFLCFILGASLLFWVRPYVNPPEVDSCKIHDYEIVTVSGVYGNGKLLGECPVSLRFSTVEPLLGQNVTIIGEVNDWGLRVLDWH